MPAAEVRAEELYRAMPGVGCCIGVVDFGARAVEEGVIRAGVDVRLDLFAALAQLRFEFARLRMSSVRARRGSARRSPSRLTPRGGGQNNGASLVGPASAAPQASSVPDDTSQTIARTSSHAL